MSHDQADEPTATNAEADDEEGRLTCALVVTHPTEPRALLLPGADGAWSMPTLATDDPAAVRAAVHAATGLDAVVLGSVGEDRVGRSEAWQQALALECVSPAHAAPQSARWAEYVAAC